MEWLAWEELGKGSGLNHQGRCEEELWWVRRVLALCTPQIPGQSTVAKATESSARRADSWRKAYGLQ